MKDLRSLESFVRRHPQTASTTIWLTVIGPRRRGLSRRHLHWLLSLTHGGGQEQRILAI